MTRRRRLHPPTDPMEIPAWLAEQQRRAALRDKNARTTGYDKQRAEEQSARLEAFAELAEQHGRRYMAGGPAELLRMADDDPEHVHVWRAEVGPDGHLR